jgi:hypothetical protein
LPKIFREKVSPIVDHLNHDKLGKEVFQSEYKENFEAKTNGQSPSKLLPKCNNEHYFPQAKDGFMGQFVSSYKKNYN